MARAKKTTKKQKEEEIEQTVEVSSPGITAIEQKVIEDCEWCFQFDEDEPQIFAWTDPELENNENPKVIFEISNRENSYINFTNATSNKTFKLFAREISEKGKQMRDSQREAFKNLENGSEDKEA